MGWASITLRVLPRLIAAVILWDILSVLIGTIYSGGFSGFVEYLKTVSGFFILMSSLLAAIAVVTGSVVVYVLSLVSVAIGKGFAGYVLSPAPFIGLGLLLAMDSIALGYREGQGKSIDIGLRGLGRGIAVVIASLGLMIGVSVFAGYALSYIVLSLIDMPRGVSLAADLLANMFSNPFIRLCIFVLAALYLYKTLSDTVEIIAVFVKPSRRLSLGVLRNREDIDIVIEYPLQTLFTFIIALFVVPVVDEFFYVLIRTIAPQLAGLGFESGIRLVADMAVFVLIFVIINRYIRGFTKFGAKARDIALPASLAVLIYATAVLISINRGLPVIQSMLNPDLETLSSRLREGYAAFYISFLYLIDLLTRLVGAAP